jgi:hypothetical protein
MWSRNAGRVTLSWAQEDSLPGERVWRITAGILRNEVSLYLDPAVSDSFFIPLRRDYALLREDHWEASLLNIAGDQQVTLLGRERWGAGRILSCCRRRPYITAGRNQRPIPP